MFGFFVPKFMTRFAPLDKCSDKLIIITLLTKKIIIMKKVQTADLLSYLTNLTTREIFAELRQLIPQKYDYLSYPQEQEVLRKHILAAAPELLVVAKTGVHYKNYGKKSNINYIKEDHINEVQTYFSQMVKDNNLQDSYTLKDIEELPVKPVKHRYNTMRLLSVLGEWGNDNATRSFLNDLSEDLSVNIGMFEPSNANSRKEMQERICRQHPKFEEIFPSIDGKRAYYTSNIYSILKETHNLEDSITISSEYWRVD